MLTSQLVCGVVNSCYSQLHERKSPNLPIAHPLLQVPYQKPKKSLERFSALFPRVVPHDPRNASRCRSPHARGRRMQSIFYANLFANGVSPGVLLFDSCVHGYESFPFSTYSALRCIVCILHRTAHFAVIRFILEARNRPSPFLVSSSRHRGPWRRGHVCLFVAFRVSSRFTVHPGEHLYFCA